jgi:hypothetical protein
MSHELNTLRHLAILWSKGQGQAELDTQLLRAQARTDFALGMLQLCRELEIPPVYDWGKDD